MVKPGYKQTEIGVIPDDWSISTLGAVSVGNLTYGINAPAVKYMPPLPNYIRITDITEDGRFDKENRASVDCTNPDKYLLHEGDVVLARTGASVGKSYLYNTNDGLLVYAGFLIRASIDSTLANPYYVVSSLRTKRYWDWVGLTSMRSGQPGINGKEYASYPLMIPSLAEQNKIAEALQDVDKQIAILEKLITKKKAIKQGTMQELLTGKKRLPGFGGEWEYKTVGNIAPLQRGFDLPQSVIEDGCYPVVFSNGVNAYHKKAMVQGPGVVTGRSGTIGKVHYIDGPYWPHNTSLWVADFKGNHPKYIYYMYQLINWIAYMTGSGVPTLNRNDVHSQSIWISTDVKEQKAIAEILSHMDSEIESLEQKLAKARQLKQGMMQQLLTGKIRLV